MFKLLKLEGTALFLIVDEKEFSDTMLLQSDIYGTVYIARNSELDCLEVFRDEINFYRHFHEYKKLVREQRKKLYCDICDNDI